MKLFSEAVSLALVLQTLRKNDVVISVRLLTENENGDAITIFAGCCQYKDGELISLDGDDYSLDMKVWQYEYVNSTLVVYIK